MIISLISSRCRLWYWAGEWEHGNIFIIASSETLLFLLWGSRLKPWRLGRIKKLSNQKETEGGYSPLCCAPTLI